MSTPNINVKKEVFGGSGLSFEDVDGGGEYCGNKKVDSAALKRGKAAVKLFSLGGILV
ncbi:hypothetical protein IJH10_00920 [Candidatus Saccharibacteria bacterium]|nr:hypothetical protein [Candidatus Saccharibacteria bacterium]MBR0415951.1 hypothetical protein [Candidatus Saccharibacteria bacterium]